MGECKPESQANKITDSRCHEKRIHLPKDNSYETLNRSTHNYPLNNVHNYALMKLNWLCRAVPCRVRINKSPYKCNTLHVFEIPPHRFRVQWRIACNRCVVPVIMHEHKPIGEGCSLRKKGVYTWIVLYCTVQCQSHPPHPSRRREQVWKRKLFYIRLHVYIYVIGLILIDTCDMWETC